MRKLFNKDKRNFEGKHQTTSSPDTPAGPNEPAGLRNHQYVCSPMLLSLHQSFTVRPLPLHALTCSPQRQFILFFEHLQLSHGILVDFYHPIRENMGYNEKQRRHGKKS